MFCVCASVVRCGGSFQACKNVYAFFCAALKICLTITCGMRQWQWQWQCMPHNAKVATIEEDYELYAWFAC